MQFKLHPERTIRHFLSMPFIYAMIIPLVFLDICTEIYHHICFRLYQIPFIKRSDYIKIDRHHLEYLTTMEKINCIYCGYANGLAAYLVAIAGATETYWCGIKHATHKTFQTPQHHQDFIEYNDKDTYKKLTSPKS